MFLLRISFPTASLKHTCQSINSFLLCPTIINVRSQSTASRGTMLLVRGYSAMKQWYREYAMEIRKALLNVLTMLKRCQHSFKTIIEALNSVQERLWQTAAFISAFSVQDPPTWMSKLLPEIPCFVFILAYNTKYLVVQGPWKSVQRLLKWISQNTLANCQNFFLF